MTKAKILLTVVVSFFLNACATQAAMKPGPQVLGAEGQVKVSKGDNGNTLLKISIRHLAPAEQVTPGGTVYVAWVQPKDGGPAQNVGQIQLTDNRERLLETVTPFKDFTVTVTSEKNATPTTPSSNPVLTTVIETSKE